MPGTCPRYIGQSSRLVDNYLRIRLEPLIQALEEKARSDVNMQDFVISLVSRTTGLTLYKVLIGCER